MNLVDSGPRAIGDSDTVVAPLGFGCRRMQPGTDNLALIETALDCGINPIDTADVYGYSADGHDCYDLIEASDGEPLP